MKRIIVSLTAVAASLAAVAVLSGVASFSSIAWGQPPGGQTKPAQPSAPHKVGLIDISYIFNNYKKFETLRDDLRAEMVQIDQRGQQMGKQLEQLKAELQSGQFKPDSPDYREREKRFDALTAEFNNYRRSAQRELLTKESQIYKTVYLEVTDAVNKWASYHKYTLIMKFNREGLDSAAETADVQRSMASPVMFFRPEDDCTIQVLEFLNRSYKPDVATPDGPANRTRRE